MTNKDFLKLFEERNNGDYSKHFTSYAVLIIDEVGYLPMDMEASNLLFQLISKRYERKSTIVTSNKPLNKWHEIFGDAVLANASSAWSNKKRRT